MNTVRLVQLREREEGRKEGREGGREGREGGKEGREQERSGGGGDGGWNRVRVTGIIHTIITVIIFV